MCGLLNGAWGTFWVGKAHHSAGSIKEADKQQSQKQLSRIKAQRHVPMPEKLPNKPLCMPDKATFGKIILKLPLLHAGNWPRPSLPRARRALQSPYSQLTRAECSESSRHFHKELSVCEKWQVLPGGMGSRPSTVGSQGGRPLGGRWRMLQHLCCQL